VIFGQFNMGDVPFRDVYIHPVILDGKGERMSKMKGNGVDPVDIIDLYGADALRFGLASLATETQDIRMPVEKVKLPDGRQVNSSERFELARPFANKFWNAARLALMNLEDFDPARLPSGDLATAGPEDFWIVGRLKRSAEEVTKDFESFQFAEAARTLREFTWSDFCDWYLELVKPRLRDDDPGRRAVAQGVVVLVLDGLCRLLHPVMPFVTEQVWQALNAVAPHRLDPATLAWLPTAESVCVAAWPAYHDRLSSRPEADAVVAQWQEKITALRNLRAERGVPPAAKVAPVVVASGETAKALLLGDSHIRSLAGAGSLRVVERADRPANSAVAVLPDAEVILPLEGLIDVEAERARHRRALADIDRQLSGHQAKLNNAAFVANAPAAVVEQTRAKVAELQAQRASVAALLGEG
jgi:valyl-tRNA synthetase